MRAVFVNHLNPGTGFVGAVRLWRFAEELARRGHQIVFLSSTHRIADAPADLEARLLRHDWTQPLLVACGPSPAEEARASARVRGIRFISRLRTAWDLVVRRGPFWSWRRAAQEFYGPLSRQFRPQLSFATFANLDCLNIAQDLAGVCGIPWVLDIKDASVSFIPPQLRRLIAHRYRDAAAVTLNSEFQRHHNPGWLVEKAPVIYSGMEKVPTGPDISDFDPQIYSLVGSVCSDEFMRDLLGAFRSYARTCPIDSSPRMRYYGKEASRVEAAAEAAGACSLVECMGMLPREQMLAECAKSAAVCYVTSPRGFHHKLIELSALGRPMICHPAESMEALDLAARHDLPLWSCAGSANLPPAFAAAARSPTRSMAYLKETFSWPVVAAQLEAVFQGVLG